MKASESFSVIYKSVSERRQRKEKHQQQQNQHKSLTKQETVEQDNNKTAKRVMTAKNKEKKQTKT